MKAVAKVLARAIAAGEFTRPSMESRCIAVLGRRWSWLPGLLKRVHKRYGGEVRPRVRELTAFVIEDQKFSNAWQRRRKPLRVEHFIVPAAEMQAHAAARSWGVPAIESAGELAQRLSLHVSELDWFADVRRLNARQQTAALQHYTYRALTKKPGGIRLIEAPKNRLKEIQKHLLSAIFEHVPAHDAAHGFVKGRNVQTFLSPHAEKEIVVKLDLRNFFTTIGAARIQAFFRMLGYPDAVADLLSGLVTATTPAIVWKQLGADGLSKEDIQDAKVLYGKPHLPQGAPTSPALANICAYRMDCRLTGLAEAAGGMYTRYADDLVFSGNGAFARTAERFALHAAVVVAEEGFAVHHRKTRVMRSSVRQHTAGLVTNKKLNLMRPDYDRLKATLTNCIRKGPDSQNRGNHANYRLHLEGRVVYAEQINIVKGAKLRDLFERINWES